jgi:hypothetical protein
LGSKPWEECDYCYEEFTPIKRGQTSCIRCMAYEEGSLRMLFDEYEGEDEEDDT